MQVSDQGKYVSVWLTRAEARDVGVQEQIRGLCRDCKEQKRRVVVFESGDQELISLTAGLLSYNRELEARRATQQESGRTDTGTLRDSGKESCRKTGNRLDSCR